MRLSEDAERVIRQLNPWWADDGAVRPKPPAFRRPLIASLVDRLRRSKGTPVEIIRGPRQVGKTTGLYQVVEDLLAAGRRGRDILFVRFDLELLREEASALLSILDWFAELVREAPLDQEPRPVILLDEVHKLPRWDEQVKHIVDTFPVRVLLTGSSSALVARGGRESLAGRSFSTELPPFSFREMLECWHPTLAAGLPPRISFTDTFDGRLEEWAEAYQQLEPQQKLSVRRQLERYYTRGGYPRLHSGEVEDDLWADYIVQTIFENVLGADIPDLFPVAHPQLLRAVYLEVARRTGQEVSQNSLAGILNERGFSTNQPTVGKYLHYLADALLIREFRRYPLAKKSSARVPAKITLSDLGVRNAILRGAPSLMESDPTVLGPLVETLVQTVVRDHNLQVHFFREPESKRRGAPVREVDFVAERVDGEVVPIEVKFRHQVRPADTKGLEHFMERFRPPCGILVTRDLFATQPLMRLLFVPLESFLLAF